MVPTWSASHALSPQAGWLGPSGTACGWLQQNSKKEESFDMSLQTSKQQIAWIIWKH